MNVLEVCAGVGGWSIGLESAGFKTVAFCEIDKYCQEVLKDNWPDVPVFSDLTNLTKEDLENEGISKIDCIAASLPCQPFSLAGSKKGDEDDRHLWPILFRLVKEIRPAYILLENVANFTNMVFTGTKVDLESEGYSVQPFIIPACGVNAKHRRDRVWIICKRNASHDMR